MKSVAIFSLALLLLLPAVGCSAEDYTSPFTDSDRTLWVGLAKGLVSGRDLQAKPLTAQERDLVHRALREAGRIGQTPVFFGELFDIDSNPVRDVMVRIEKSEGTSWRGKVSYDERELAVDEDGRFGLKLERATRLAVRKEGYHADSMRSGWRPALLKDEAEREALLKGDQALAKALSSEALRGELGQVILGQRILMLSPRSGSQLDRRVGVITFKADGPGKGAPLAVFRYRHGDKVPEQKDFPLGDRFIPESVNKEQDQRKNKSDIYGYSLRGTRVLEVGLETLDEETRHRLSALPEDRWHEVLGDAIVVWAEVDESGQIATVPSKAHIVPQKDKTGKGMFIYLDGMTHGRRNFENITHPVLWPKRLRILFLGEGSGIQLGGAMWPGPPQWRQMPIAPEEGYEKELELTWEYFESQGQGLRTTGAFLDRTWYFIRTNQCYGTMFLGSELGHDKYYDNERTPMVREPGIDRENQDTIEWQLNLWIQPNGGRVTLDKDFN